MGGFVLDGQQHLGLRHGGEDNKKVLILSKLLMQKSVFSLIMTMIKFQQVLSHYYSQEYYHSIDSFKGFIDEWIVWCFNSQDQWAAWTWTWTWTWAWTDSGITCEFLFTEARLRTWWVFSVSRSKFYYTHWNVFLPNEKTQHINRKWHLRQASRTYI